MWYIQRDCVLKTPFNSSNGHGTFNGSLAAKSGYPDIPMLRNTNKLIAAKIGGLTAFGVKQWKR
jgi:hypothetical protein